MSKTIYHYNVYDNGELILENVTPKEIREAIGENIQNVTVYASSGHKFKGRYTFESANDDTIVKTQSELAFEKEWAEAVDPLKMLFG